ncbi:MAG: Fe(2+) transporter permease subunit FeoB [Phycisphaerae bacterium]|nr:Fe(2+) transporter permease subunit FeoB [Phycisphaerae bacterium]
MDRITIALAGNPNCGKTTLFNALTGASQRVGNWPGVTVERIEGRYEYEQTDVQVVDLPGIYSFSAHSADESISRKYILMEKPAVVVNIIDATNLERGLYLTAQLLEMKVPMVVALNMMDVVRQRKLRIEVEHLAKHLDCPVIPIVASRKKGIEELRRAIHEVARERTVPGTRVAYDMVVEEALRALMKGCESAAADHRVHPRWLAVKLLENDELALQFVGGQCDAAVTDRARAIEKHVGQAIGLVMADGRYGFIHGLTRDVLHRDREIRKTLSDAVDKVILNRVVGIPIFLAVMLGVFLLTINVGAPFIDFFDQLCGTIFVDGFGELLQSWGAGAFLTAILADGLGGGIQTIATFIPPIFFIFLCLSILEDSGYMARGAFIMDRLLRKIGLPGKAFLPMLVGFGCNVPAILATRTLENPRDRIMTVVMNPFMSCGARLPVYTLFAVAFFPGRGGVIVFGLYMIGILLAICTGLLLKKTIFQGEPGTFVMELPPYHFPTLSGVLFHTWRRLMGFILRAGKVILLAVVVLSVLNNVGFQEGRAAVITGRSDRSLLSGLGRSVTPVFHPMGITHENWPATVGLFTGLLAKETVISTLDALYSTPHLTGQDAARTYSPTQPTKVSHETAEPKEEPFDFWGGIVGAVRSIPEGFAPGAGEKQDNRELAGQLRDHFGGRAEAAAYLLFVLIYAPCIAAVAAIYRETNFRWMLFSVLYTTGLAWVVATLFYQVCTFARHPASSALWISLATAMLLVPYAVLRLWMRYQKTESPL